MGSQQWPSEEDAAGFKEAFLEYSEKMKVIGKAFMRALADTLGHHEVFEELQKDPYWCVLTSSVTPLLTATGS
jgi:isopenicillin N synthase-like dioxygenase